MSKSKTSHSECALKVRNDIENSIISATIAGPRESRNSRNTVVYSVSKGRGQQYTATSSSQWQHLKKEAAPRVQRDDAGFDVPAGTIRSLGSATEGWGDVFSGRASRALGVTVSVIRSKGICFVC